MQLAYVETFESKKEPRKSKGRPARVHQGTQGEGLCGSVGVRARVCVWGVGGWRLHPAFKDCGSCGFRENTELKRGAMEACPTHLERPNGPRVRRDGHALSHVCDLGPGQYNTYIKSPGNTGWGPQ